MTEFHGGSYISAGGTVGWTGSFIGVPSGGTVAPPVGSGFLHARYVKVNVPVNRVKFTFKSRGVAGP